MSSSRLFAHTFICCFIILILSGCWDQVNIEDRGFVIGIALDKADMANEIQHEFTETNQFMIPSKLGGGEQNEGGGKQFSNLSVSGNSLFDIDQKTNSTAARQPFYEHTKVTIISEELAKEPGVFESIMDGFLRDRSMRRSVKIFIADGKASDILEIKPEVDKTPSMYLDSLVEKHDVNLELTPPKKLGDLQSLLINEDGYTIDHIHPLDVRIQSNGVSVFNGSNNQLVGKLNREETKGLNLITRTNKAGIIHFDIRNYLMDYSIDTSNSNIKINAKDPNQIDIAVHIETKGSIAEMFGSKSLLNETYIEEIEQKINEQIKHLVTGTIKKAQEEFKVDFLGFSNELRIKHYPVWKNIKDNWDRGDNLFSKSNITVSANSEILSIGPIDRTKDKRDE